MATQLIRTEGLPELRRVLKQITENAPEITTKSIEHSLEDNALPRIDARTPRGKTGGLAGANRVQVLQSLRVAVLNSKAYANAIHWGREYWPNLHSENRRVAPIQARPWIYETVQEQQPELLQDIARALEHALEVGPT